MCRLAGYIDHSRTKERAMPILQKMNDSQSYGGPDDTDLLCLPPVGLAHNRLSIFDLSDQGRQPLSWNGIHIIYNGALYNFKELRVLLTRFGYSFFSESDTEVILKAYHFWGPSCITHFKGIFAFVIYDSHQSKLLLTRDHTGVKPLYIYQKDQFLLFASELKAFYQHPDFEKEINASAFANYLRVGYFSGTTSVFKKVQKIHPGTYLTYDLKTNKSSIKTYYHLPKLDHNLVSHKTTTVKETILDLKILLRDSFRAQWIADVPMGIFLSGGIDSSLLTAILQSQLEGPIPTFNLGFEDPNFNESQYAKQIATALGTDHHELRVSTNDLASLLPEFAYIYDEPFGDSSGLASYLISALAREQVKVIFSGEGADELFGGYTKYQISKRWYPRLRKMPKAIRQILQQLSPQKSARVLKNQAFFKRFHNLENKFNKLQIGLEANSLDHFFQLSSGYLDPKMYKALTGQELLLEDSNASIPAELYLSYLGRKDLQAYLPNDLLTKLDRATMQHALEGRVPYLDPKIIDFALQLPDSFKLRDGQSKWILRQLLQEYIPKHLINRPKQGFQVPIEQCLKQILKPEVQAMAHNATFHHTFQLNPLVLQKLVRDFYANSRYVNAYPIWFLWVAYHWKNYWEI